jgi:hypothetical protein
MKSFKPPLEQTEVKQINMIDRNTHVSMCVLHIPENRLFRIPIDHNRICSTLKKCWLDLPRMIIIVCDM